MITKIGKHTYGHQTIHIHDFNFRYHVEIGSFCSISSPVDICLGIDHRVDWATTYPFGHHNKELFNKFSGEGYPASKGNVIIGNDVWIGRSVTILSGVVIGDGAVIGCESVVTKDVEPYSVVAGNPAKFKKLRFDKDTIDKLLKYKWWDLSDDQINDISPLLCSNDFETLFKQLQILRE
jgi:acetyltransferase-like isoleucine patch superfamily enzyme